MEKSDILEILYDWNFWKKELYTGEKREDYTNRCIKFLKTNIVVAIIGVRRSGKSYIMRQVIRALIENNIKSKNILMINFEDKRIVDFYPGLIDEIYKTYTEILNPDEIPFIFLDEIHNVPNWERWVRTMHELKKANIVISGSSSKLLSGELATVLTGRHLDIFTFPLGFEEFIHFRNLEIKDELDVIANKINIQRFLNEYFEFGGFPEVVLSDNKKELLLTYFDDILTKDIEKRYKLKKSEKLRMLARFYMTNISNSVTFNSLAKFLNTSTVTVGKFSSYLEEANLIFFVKRFSFKVKEQEKAPRKIYSIDTGLSNAVGFKFTSNYGKILENLVAIELRKKEVENVNTKIYYWHNQQHEEVDFVIKNGLNAEQLIQVCWNINDYKTKEREIKALLKASDELKCDDLLIVNQDKEGKETIKNKEVKYISLATWLLKIKHNSKF
ncbi:ATPase [groundwater metagenome]|uniref:ATPase n=1 Tax=groundwater metagenome TaxID=717931 RepID=A0A098E839_9ZZZZ